MIQVDGTMYVASDTNLITSTSLYNQFIYSGDTLLMATPRTITYSNDTGYQGEICFDANYMYYCVANNTWKRMALNTW
jgi:hypothetical protein